MLGWLRRRKRLPVPAAEGEATRAEADRLLLDAIDRHLAEAEELLGHVRKGEIGCQRWCWVHAAFHSLDEARVDMADLAEMKLRKSSSPGAV